MPPNPSLHQKLRAFALAAQELNAELEANPQDVSQGYPFPHSFEEVAHDIQNWTHLQESNIR